MANIAIIALGGTGQTVLDFFLRSHLLRVGPLEKAGLKPNVKVIVIDQETERAGDRRPAWEVLRDFLVNTSASSRFSFERHALKVDKANISAAINSAQLSQPMKPEVAYASRKLRESRLDDGLFATPAALGFAWQYYARELISDLHTALGDVNGAVVVTSTFGGAGTGFTPSVLQLLRSRGVRFISVIALSRYLTFRGASADLIERYDQNHAEFVRNLDAYDAGGHRLFVRQVLESSPDEIWDKDADRKFPPDHNPVWTAEWWIGRLLQEYENPVATNVASIPVDPKGVNRMRDDLKERSQKAKNAVRYLVERNFLQTISRDPLGRAYVGRFLRDGLLAFWRKWMDRVEGESFDQFVPQVSNAMSEAFRQIDGALVARQPATIDFRALREALASSELPPEQQLHPILEAALPRAEDVLRAAAAELLYRLMRRRADK